MHKLLPTEKSATLKLALRLSWVTFWPTALYGAVFVAPFTVILGFAGRGVISTACVLFLGAISWSFYIGLRHFYLVNLEGERARLFRGALLPLVLGKQPKDVAWKEDGSPTLGLIWPLLRERLTAFCFGALVGSIIISAVREPVAAFLYLPCWFIADVILLRQLLVKRLTFKHDFAAPLLDDALAFFSGRKMPNPLRFALKLFVLPVLFAVVWWSIIPVVTGALSFGPSADVVKFMEDATDPPQEKNGVYALLGLGADAGEDIAKKLKKGETPPPVKFDASQEIACRADAEPLSDEKKAALEKYDALAAYEFFDWPKDLLRQGGISYLDFYLEGFAALATLKTHAIVQQSLAGERETALEAWLRHAGFLQRVLKTSRISLLEFDVLRESRAAAMQALPCILHGDAELAKKHMDDIRTAFGILSPKDLPLREVVDNETRLMGWAAGRQVQVIFKDLRKRAPQALNGLFMDLARISFRRGPDVLQTKLYWLMREMHQAVDEFDGDIPKMHERMQKLNDRYAVRNGRLLISVSDLLGPQVGAIANIILSEMPEAYERIFFNPDDYDTQRMLLAHAGALAAGVLPEGMGDFLASSTLKTLAKGEAFVWDADNKMICRPQEKAEEGKEDSHNAKDSYLCLDTKPFVE